MRGRCDALLRRLRPRRRRGPLDDPAAGRLLGDLERAELQRRAAPAEARRDDAARGRQLRALLNGAYDELTARRQATTNVSHAVLGGALYRQRSPKGIGPIAFMESHEGPRARSSTCSRSTRTTASRTSASATAHGRRHALAEHRDRQLRPLPVARSTGSGAASASRSGSPSSAGRRRPACTTSTPSPRRKQAKFLKQSVDVFRTQYPRVGRLIWFLIKDEPVTSHGRPPEHVAVRLPPPQRHQEAGLRDLAVAQPDAEEAARQVAALAEVAPPPGRIPACARPCVGARLRGASTSSSRGCSIVTSARRAVRASPCARCKRCGGLGCFHVLSLRDHRPRRRRARDLRRRRRRRRSPPAATSTGACSGTPSPSGCRSSPSSSTWCSPRTGSTGGARRSPAAARVVASLALTTLVVGLYTVVATDHRFNSYSMFAFAFWSSARSSCRRCARPTTPIVLDGDAARRRAPARGAVRRAARGRGGGRRAARGRIGRDPRHRRERRRPAHPRRGHRGGAAGRRRARPAAGRRARCIEVLEVCRAHQRAAARRAHRDGLLAHEATYVRGPRAAAVRDRAADPPGAATGCSSGRSTWSSRRCCCCCSARSCCDRGPRGQADVARPGHLPRPAHRHGRAAVRHAQAAQHARRGRPRAGGSRGPQRARTARSSRSATTRA